MAWGLIMPTVVLRQKDLFTKRFRKVPAIDPSELQIQIAVGARLRLQCKSGIIWYHVPNGEARDPRTGAKLKAMGVRPGVSDLEFVFQVPRPNLYLELKARGRDLTPDQKIFRADVRALGHCYEMADTIDEAVRVLKQYRIIP